MNSLSPPPPGLEASLSLPSSTSTSKSTNNGQQLLNYIKKLEKEIDKDTLDNAINLFDTLIAIYSRQGIFQGDTTRAKRILAFTSNNNSNNNSITGTKKGRKGKRNKGNNNNNNNSTTNNDLQIYQGSDILEQSTPESNIASQEESLIFSALLRIFTTTSNNDNNKQQPQVNLHGKHDNIGTTRHHPIILSQAADLCFTISERVQSFSSSSTISDTCLLAEYELLAQHGKQLLNGMTKALQKHIDQLQKLTANSVTNEAKASLATAILDETNPIIVSLKSCLAACTSLVSLFGTKLSRSTALLVELEQIAWTLVTVSDYSLARLAAGLIATIPLGGGTGPDGKTPHELWTSTLMDCVVSLSILLDTITPLSKGKSSPSSSSKKDQWTVKNTIQSITSNWIDEIRNGGDHAVKIFLCCAHAFTTIIVMLLSRDTVSPTAMVTITGATTAATTGLQAKVSVDFILDLIETMLSFPIAAEALYYRTKKRLRMEPVENGILNPTDIAFDVANRIKVLGHLLLNSFIDAMGGSSLMPFARRIYRISYAALLTSSSSPLRKVLDPTTAVKLEGQKRRWLHNSILLRTMAIQSVEHTVSALGSDCGGHSSSTNNNSTPSSLLSSSSASIYGSTDGERCLGLVVGCLLEQITMGNNQSGEDGSNGNNIVGHGDDWGSIEERSDLVIAAANTLITALGSCSGFLSVPIRSLIDSTVATCLSKTVSFHPGAIIAANTVKIALLNLGRTCCTTPWGDGAASSIGPILAFTARQLLLSSNLGDEHLTMAANWALAAYDSYLVPRAPALQVVTRTVTANDTSNSNQESVALSMANKLETTRNEIITTQLEAQQRKTQQNTTNQVVSKDNENNDKNNNNDSTKTNNNEQPCKKKAKTQIDAKRDMKSTPTMAKTFAKETSPEKSSSSSSSQKKFTNNDTSNQKQNLVDNMDENDAGVNDMGCDKVPIDTSYSIPNNIDKRRISIRPEPATNIKTNNNDNDDDDGSMDDDFPEIVDDGPDSDDE